MRYRVRTYFGSLLIFAVLVSTVALIVSLAVGIYPVRTAGFHVVPREPYTHSFDPIALVEFGLAPETLVDTTDEVAAAPKDPAVRYIGVTPERITLFAAGQPIRVIESGPVSDVRQVMNLIGDPAWIEEPISGQVVLKAALVTFHGTNLLIGAPLVSELLLLDTPSVFVGTRGGTLTFDRVTVRSYEAETVTPSRYRPFVVATDRAQMNIFASQFFDLGWDWNASYGVSWEQGATGQAIGSVFERNFIGAYTGRARGLVFRDCVFRNNALYGLDPHTYSKNLTIDGVVAEGNRAHGIIFSDYVRDSVIKNSISRNNGENGIMMDKHATDNQIINNTVTGNQGDGLVTARSPRNVFSNNVIEQNRIGIRISPSDVATTVVTENHLEANVRPNEYAVVDSSNTMVANGGQWNWPLVKDIWMWAGGVMGAFAVWLVWATRRRRPNGRQLAAV